MRHKTKQKFSVSPKVRLKEILYVLKETKKMLMYLLMKQHCKIDRHCHKLIFCVHTMTCKILTKLACLLSKNWTRVLKNKKRKLLVKIWLQALKSNPA